MRVRTINNVYVAKVGECYEAFNYDPYLLERPECEEKIIEYFFNKFQGAYNRFFHVSTRTINFWKHSKNSIPEFICKNPNTPPKVLCFLAQQEKYIEYVFSNPAIDLLLVENPRIFDEWFWTSSLRFLATKYIPDYMFEKKGTFIDAHEIIYFAQQKRFKFITDKYSTEGGNLFYFYNKLFVVHFDCISMSIYILEIIDDMYKAIEQKDISNICRIRLTLDWRQILPKELRKAKKHLKYLSKTDHERYLRFQARK